MRRWPDVAALVILCSIVPRGTWAQEFDDLIFHTVTPCRLFDTRLTAAGPLAVNETRGFNVFGSGLTGQGGEATGCGLPTLLSNGDPQTIAIAVNVVAVSPQSIGNLKGWAGDISEPVHGAIVNYQSLNPALNIANATILAVRTTAPLGSGTDVKIKANGGGTQVVADVVGYFTVSAVRSRVDAIFPGSPIVLGGFDGNSAAKGGSTIGGGGQVGSPNSVTDTFGTIAGGVGNTAGVSASVSGGQSNVASGGFSAIGGGEFNTASGNGSMVPGGAQNTASGDHSFAAGSHANAAGNGSFVWADSSPFDFGTNTDDVFRVRATGGIGLVTAIDNNGNVTSNCFINTNGNLTCSGTISGGSDRASKENFSPVDDQRILDEVASLPMSTWSYKSEGRSVRHIGPTAQDFQAAFAVGSDDKHITMVDADGVALAAVQGLYQILKERDAEIAAMRSQIRELQRAASAQRASIDRLSAARFTK